MDYDKALAYLVAVATVINLLTGSAKIFKTCEQVSKIKSDAPPPKENVASMPSL